MSVAIAILRMSQGADEFRRLFLEVQALSYARLAAAHGDPEALHFAAMISAAISASEDASTAGVTVGAVRADALAMLDVATDIAPPAERGALESRLLELSGQSDADTATIAQPFRNFWGLVVHDELEAARG